MVQELIAGSGVAGIEEGRCGDGGLMENQAGAARSQGGGGIPEAGVQEGSEEVARNLPCVDVVLVMSSVRAKRGWSGGTTVTQNGGILGGVSARGWRRASCEASVGCGGARETPGCGRGAAELANGGEQRVQQRSSGGAERRRS
jgi:hypothetical protein